jgi:hypothetical protein
MSFDFREPRIGLAPAKNQNKHCPELKKHTGKKGCSLNRTDIANSTRSHGGGADLPGKTVRYAFDFVIQEIDQTFWMARRSS